MLGIAYSQSCRDANGQLLGVIGSELSLEDISAFLGKLGIGKTGLAFLVDQEGTLVACSTGAAVTDANHQTVRAWRAADTRIAAIAAYLKAIQASPADSTGSARRPVELAGTNYMIKVSRLASNTGLRWLIITAVPESDFLGPIHAAQWINLSVASIVVLLVIAFGLFLAKRMTAPILALTAHARKIGEGQLDAQTLMGKAPAGVAARAARAGVACAAIGGGIRREDEAALKKVFARVESLSDFAGSREAALREPARWLEEWARRTDFGF